MKEWMSYERSTVLFNKTHWVSGEVMRVYLHNLVATFPKQKIALIMDKHTAHIGPEFDESLRLINNNNEVIYPLYIPEGMTSVMQLADVAINKPLKTLLKQIYFNKCDKMYFDNKPKKKKNYQIK